MKTHIVTCLHGETLSIYEPMSHEEAQKKFLELNQLPGCNAGIAPNNKEEIEDLSKKFEKAGVKVIYQAG